MFSGGIEVEDWLKILKILECFPYNFNLHTYKKLLNICRASSDAREFAKLMNEQYTAAHAAHFICNNKVLSINPKHKYLFKVTNTDISTTSMVIAFQNLQRVGINLEQAFSGNQARQILLQTSTETVDQHPDVHCNKLRCFVLKQPFGKRLRIDFRKKSGRKHRALQRRLKRDDDLSDVFRPFGIPVYRSGCPNSSAHKKFQVFFFQLNSTKNTLIQRSLILKCINYFEMPQETKMRTEEKNNETNSGQSESRNCQRTCFHTLECQPKKSDFFILCQFCMQILCFLC